MDKTILKFSDDCIQCGVCLSVCAMLRDLKLTPGEIASQLAQGEYDPAVLDAIQRCDLCGLCAQECLVNLRPAEFFRSAREYLMKEGLLSPEAYDVMLVDQDWNFFTIYRSMMGISYADLERPRYETLFFPGCTLASYAPELTRAAYGWLQTQGMDLGFSDVCCGKPLDSIGLTDRKDDLQKYIAGQMKAAGARRLVTSCPNCYYHLAGQLKDVEVASLYDLMSRAGVHLAGAETLTVHDACPDRGALTAAEDVRSLLSGYPLVEMEHNRASTICCGSGGIVSMIDPPLCEQRAQRRMDEFQASGADRLVAACMACAHRLARVDNHDGADQQGQVVHCLELAFGIPVDYARVQANLRQMWDGEWGETNRQRLAQAQSFTKRAEGV